MLDFFREDWEQLVDGKFQMGMEEFLAYRRSLPRQTLRGEYVKSFGERLIANILFEHDLSYKYERSFHWNGVNYRPDFTISNGKGGVIIEYFGLEGESDYDEQAEQKRHFWAKMENWNLLDYCPADIVSAGIEAFTSRLVSNLRELGWTAERLPEEEVWQRIKVRALDRFTSAMKTFVGRCRKLSIDPRQIRTMIARHRAATKAEELFLEVGAEIYESYLKRLSAKGKEDFDGLMWRASESVRNGSSRFVRDRGREKGDLSRLRFLMIDEFQDFSVMFYALVTATMQINLRASLFCVGDDWQAINAFAGSDLSYFEAFEDHFVDTVPRWIRSNYRSRREIVELGNTLMHGQGKPAQPIREGEGWVRVAHLNEMPLTQFEKDYHRGDDITPAVLRIVRKMLDNGKNVVLLCRLNRLPWYVSYKEKNTGDSVGLRRFRNHVRSFLPEDDRRRVGCSTVHKYKGLQEEAVVILDAVKRSYPFIHPTWVFLRIFGDSLEKLEKDERRLFYVALTRAQSHLALICDDRNESQFLEEIRHCQDVRDLEWQDFPAVAVHKGGKVEVRVSNAFDVHDNLKAIGYKFDRERSKTWWRLYDAEGFSIESILEQDWAKSGVPVLVTSEDGSVIYPPSEKGDEK